MAAKPATTTLTLDIVLAHEPIAGEIRLPDGSGRPFEGYLELVTQLERARATAGPLAQPPARRRGPTQERPD